MGRTQGAKDQVPRKRRKKSELERVSLAQVCKNFFSAPKERKGSEIRIAQQGENEVTIDDAEPETEREVRIEDADICFEVKDDEPENSSLTMEKFIKAVKEQISKEEKNPSWLTRYLVESQGWIRQEQAHRIAAKLGQNVKEWETLKAVYVWLPKEVYDQRLCCPTCGGENIIGHGWHSHIGRRVVALHDNYYLTGKRLKCQDQECGRTFMSYDPQAVRSLPLDISCMFPAYLTEKGALDTQLVDMLRPLFDSGMRAETFARMILELHSKEFTRRAIRREMRNRKLKALKQKVAPFRSFVKEYHDFSPSGRYISDVYCDFSESIRKHLTAQIKCREAKHVSIDGSYKETRVLARYNGEPLYGALVSLTNEYGEVRSIFHSLSESHALFEEPLQRMIDTHRKYNMNLPSVVFTDRPRQDRRYFERALQLSQLSEIGGLHGERYESTFLETEKFNLMVNAFRSIAGAWPQQQRVYAIAIEENMIGICFNKEDPAEEKESSIVLVTSMTKTRSGRAGMPQAIKDICADPNLYALIELRQLHKMKQVQTFVSLMEMGKSRGVVQSSNTSISHLAKKVLGTEDIEVKHKTPREKVASKARLLFLLYHELCKKPDLTERLKPSDVKPGLHIWVTPTRGLCCRPCARGRIIASSNWTTPQNILPTTRVSQGIVALIEVTQVEAPTLRVPYTIMGRKATLEDFGKPPFTLRLPLSMLVEELPTAQQPTLMKVVEQEEENQENQQQQEEKQLHDEIHEEQMIALIRECKNAEEKLSSMPDGLSIFGPLPTQIKDELSNVVGDIFHYMQRVPIPKRHVYGKAYFTALREAFFIWDEKVLYEVQETMRKKAGWTSKKIENMMYFKHTWFTARVPRVVPKPSQLYYRVRSVYSVFGGLKDGTTPLFNAHAWKKAANVLKEIEDGLISDPPGIQLYTYRQKEGNLLRDKYGNALIECSRGTCSVEGFHRTLSRTFRGWTFGVRMADCLLMERVHRHNTGISRRKRHLYPNVGHYDSWLIDILIRLVEENHNVRLFPGWTEAGAFAETEEAFGTVPLQPKDLQKKVGALHINESDLQKLTKDEIYISKAMKSKLPYTPVISSEERSLFARMCLSGKYLTDRGKEEDAIYEQMALDWVDHVNIGKKIFPKLGSYLKDYSISFQKNRRIQDANREAQLVTQALAAINNAGMAMASRKVQIARPVSVASPISYGQTPSSAVPISIGSITYDISREELKHVPKRRGKDAKGRKCRSCAICHSPNCKGRGNRKLCPQNKTSKTKL